jgi:hypothetical protein
MGLRETGYKGIDCILCGSGLGAVAGSYKKVSESLNSIKVGTFLDLQLSASLDSAPWR